MLKLLEQLLTTDERNYWEAGKDSHVRACPLLASLHNHTLHSGQIWSSNAAVLGLETKESSKSSGCADDRMWCTISLVVHGNHLTSHHPKIGGVKI